MTQLHRKSEQALADAIRETRERSERRITYVADMALEALTDVLPPETVKPLERPDPDLDAAKRQVWWDGAWCTVTVEFDHVGDPGE